MRNGKLCISADSHVVESAEFFEPLVKRFGDSAPRVVVADPARGPQLALGNGQLGLFISGFLQANTDFTSPDAVAELAKGYKLARPGCYDIAERLKDQAIDGIDAEVLYPSVLFNVYQVPRRDIISATFATYNDWITDYCSAARDRLFALGCLQLWDLDEAIAEMERCKKMGHVGVCIAATAPPEHLYSDPWYDKFWAAAEALEMPLNMHIFTGATPNHGLPFRQAGSPLAFAGVMFSIADIIQSGVCKRFPRLKFVITEFETGWTAIMLKRLDWSYIRSGGARTQPNPHPPSYYWKRQFYVTFEDDPLGIRSRDFIGTETMLWGNDYPHGDSVFPNSQSVLTNILRDCTRDEIYQMTVKNVVDLYKLPFTLTGPQQSYIADLIDAKSGTAMAAA
jgi:predicted TIM-barrel fold metal-dependent hydrolase